MEVSGWTDIAVLVKQKNMFMKYCHCNELFFCVILLLIELIKYVFYQQGLSVSLLFPQKIIQISQIFIQSAIFYSILSLQLKTTITWTTWIHSVLHNLKKPTQTKIQKDVKLKQNNNLEWLLPLQLKISNK